MPGYDPYGRYGPWGDVYGAPGGGDPFAPGANVPQTDEISEPVWMDDGRSQPRREFDWGTANAGGGLGGELGDALGSIIGELAGAGNDRAAATEYLNKILGEYQGFNPNEQVSTLGPSAFNGIRQNPNLRSQEESTLAHLKGVADGGGLDAQGRAMLGDVQRSNAEAAYGQQKGILASAARRGSAAPGRDIVSAQIAGQGAADRNAASGLHIAADAEDRALQAALGGGELAGRMGRDDWTRSAQTASANDTVSRFNAQNLQNVFERNISNDWRKRQGVAGAYGDLAQGKLNDANRWGKMGRGIGRGVGGVAGFLSGGALGGG